MLPKRIIPFFLLKGKRLVKGTNFKNFVDVGDPLSQAMIFDAQGAEEIAIVDIEASLEKRLINTDLITAMIEKCRLPIAVGGGIDSIESARKCFVAGADKIIVNTHAVNNPSFITELSNEFGSQSVMVSVDVRKNNLGNYDVFNFSGNKKVEISFEEIIEKFNNMAGEVLITSIDKEGTLSGFDCDLYRTIRKVVTVPLIASGGAGSYDDIVTLCQECDIDAFGLGKMLFLKDYDIVRIKSYLTGKKVNVRDS